MSDMNPAHTEREAMLMANMRRWRRVAELEHAKHCKRRGDCSRHIEDEYMALLEAEA